MRNDAVPAGRGQVEALVEQVARAEPGAHEVPRQSKQRGPRLGVDAARPVEELLEERAELRVVELAAVGVARRLWLPISMMISATRGNQTARSERIGTSGRGSGNHTPSPTWRPCGGLQHGAPRHLDRNCSPVRAPVAFSPPFGVVAGRRRSCPEARDTSSTDPGRPSLALARARRPNHPDSGRESAETTPGGPRRPSTRSCRRSRAARAWCRR